MEYLQIQFFLDKYVIEININININLENYIPFIFKPKYYYRILNFFDTFSCRFLSEIYQQSFSYKQS